MTDEYLFSKFELRLVIEDRRQAVRAELDGMDDNRLLNTALAELQTYAAQKYRIDLPVLGQPTVDESPTKITVGRYGGPPRGGEPTVQVDAYSYTIEIPFTGHKDVFWSQGSRRSMMPPRGSLRGDFLTTTIVQRESNAEELNQAFERFVGEINEHLGWMKGDIDTWNASIAGLVGEVYQYRKDKAERAGAVASGLKFPVKRREDRATTYAAPVVQRKTITPQLPAARLGAPPEPVLSNDIYRSILDTLKQMSLVMERSPHAYAKMDEETLRFQFLVPLNANFEGEARGEVFNYGGKTDILISAKGRNIFVGECKFWHGAKALSETADQILGYLAWRDTKCAILLFNRNRKFSEVLAQIKPTLERHPQFVSFDGVSDETEMAFTFRHPDDAERRLKLTVLAFDIPAP
jgi:hypothetical protein